MKLKEVLLRRREVHVDGFELGYKRPSRDAEIARAVAAVVGAISRFTKTKRSNQINPITICRCSRGRRESGYLSVAAQIVSRRPAELPN